MDNSLTLNANSIVPGSFNDDDHHIHPVPEAPALYAIVILLIFFIASRIFDRFKR